MKSSLPLPPVVFLMGPTASGKTALAIELYQTELFEIVSVDSAMVYQQMDIGSAKPSPAELLLAPHHLIDFIDPADVYSAAQFVQDAKLLIKQIHSRGRVPLLVGGTMLYFKSLKDGLADLPAANVNVREELRLALSQNGIEHLHERLSQVDPVTSQRLHKTDSQRIMRALEVFLVSGKPLSQWHQEQSLTSLPNPLFSVALAPEDRQVLHQRIESRFKQMMEQGFMEEVEGLYTRNDLSLDCPSMKSVGYRQLWQYLSGDMTLEEALERAVIATRQLAKRQFTWLKRWPELAWFDPLNSQQLKLARDEILNFVVRESR